MGKKQFFAAVCGVKNSGKTTLLEKIVRTLVCRGFKVAVIKHDGHEFMCDVPGTDSWRFVEAGACGAAVFSKRQIFIRRLRADEEGAEDPAAIINSLKNGFPEADVILVEGCKGLPIRKIEVVRSEVSELPSSNPEGRFLIVSDLPKEHFGEMTLPFESMEEIADEILREDEGKGQDTCAVLLRGGKSRRLGTDKAALLWKENTTFLQAVARQMDFLQEKYISVAANREDLCRLELPGLPAGWTVLPDRVTDCGPMGGIWTALTACRSEWALVASCDIPAIESTLFLRLLEETESDRYEIIYPVTPDGKSHLTCALYRKRIAPVLAQQILKGEYRLRDLLTISACKEVMITAPSQICMLTNVNTKEDLNQIKNMGFLT